VRAFHRRPCRRALGSCRLRRTREIIEICRKVWTREELSFTRAVSSPCPCRWARAPASADGWLPFLFVPEKAAQVWGRSLEAGRAKRDAALVALQISAGGPLAIGEGADVRQVAHQFWPRLALYIGGMGVKGANFYNDVVCRYGFEREAGEIQDLYVAGEKEQAARVPDALVEAMSLCGPESFVAERVAAFKEAGVTQLQVEPIPTGGESVASLVAKVRELAG